MSAIVQRKLQQAREALQGGDVASTEALCLEILRHAPRNPDALWLLGTAYVSSGRPEPAVPLLEQVVAAAPKHGFAYDSLGLAHLMLGRWKAAEDALRRAVALHPSVSSVRMRLGAALLQQERYTEAIPELERAVSLDPSTPDARLNLGRAYFGASRHADAAREFDRILEVEPNHADALFNRGVVALEQREIVQARAFFERIFQSTPGYPEAHEQLALVDLATGRFRHAADHLRALARLQPENAAAKVMLANALVQVGALDEAEAAARDACRLSPADAGGYGALAQVHFLRRELGKAQRVVEEGYARTQSRGLLGMQVHLLRHLCDWPKWQPLWQTMAADLEEHDDLGSPFWLLCEDTTPAEQRSYTERWAARRFGTERVPSPPARVRRDGERVRIGYFSPDFHEHATSYLLAEVLELHDRGRFEVFAYSYGPEDQSPMRARVRAAVEHFVDVARDTDEAILARMRADALDVLVDLKGYVMGDRLSVLAQRPCSRQFTWIGYPGTTGAPFIDGLIADPFVVPAGAEAAYSERVLRMPHCYQPNDRQRATGETLSRAAYALPEDAFVFCCFNQAVKITPTIWQRWMNLLREVPRSILWLLEDNRWACENLRCELSSAGLQEARLVFAPRLPLPEHLARYRAADLALDTFPYTSHTTASDALWMGCPLVALAGDTFAARVSGSIVSSCDLADLVTRSPDEYEALALRLATDSDFLAVVRTRLARARDTAPLFDSVRFTRELEALYLAET